MIALLLLQAALAGTITDTSCVSVTAGLSDRVVVLGAALGETVFALDQGARVIAVDATLAFPAEAAAKPRSRAQA